MKQSTRILVATGGIVVLLIGAKFALSLFNQPSDEALIAEAVKEGLKASKEGRPGGVLDKLSANLTVNGDDTPGARPQISEYVKKLKPDVEFTSLKPQVFGDEARIETPAKMSVGILGMTQSVNLEKVTITLQRENTHDFFIFPRKAWKVTDVKVDVNALQMFMP